MTDFRAHFQANDKTLALLSIVREEFARECSSVRRALIVGCGDGREAAAVAREWDCPVAAIDIEDAFSSPDPRVKFQRMDACSMGFRDATFDFVYSFHALEHMREPVRAIAEISRVLVNGGIYCIGTPNRSRLVGYVGSPGVSWRQVIRWNAVDWQARLQGRFRNSMGAHAGFTEDELLRFGRLIGTAREISGRYYSALYSRYTPALAAIQGLRVERFCWPSIYVLGRHEI